MRVALLVFLAGVVLMAASIAADVIHLKSGEVIPCEIVAITDNVLTYKTTIDLGGGRTASAQPTISPEVVDYIEFGPLPGEAEILATQATVSLKEIEKLWDEASRHLHRPRSNAGEIGLILGDRLLAEPEKFRWEFALAIFDRLLARDWNPQHRTPATKGRLQALIQLGRLDQATAEARQLEKESEDPEMLIEARFALAQADFEKLKALEEENPRWEDDETVRPERERLFHEVIDQFLWPYLFYGTEENLAARGLVAAARVHQFGKDSEASTACLQDVVLLYPGTLSAPEARAMLDAAESKNQPPSTDTDDGNP